MKKPAFKPIDITLSIDSLGAGGDGVAVYGDKSVYTPKTAPGDIARVKIEKDTNDGMQGRLMAIESPSPDRITPPCPHYTNCGGCALQHINDESYRAWKIEKVMAPLTRAGVKAAHVEPPVFLPAATRRRTTMIATQKDIIGYHAHHSHHVVDVRACAVLAPGLDTVMQGLRSFIARLLQGQKSIDVMVQDVDGLYDMVITGLRQPLGLARLEALAELAAALDIARIAVREKETGTPEIIFTRQAVIKNFGGLAVQIPPGAFLQPSLAGEKALIDTVLSYAKGAQNIADLFSGCGTFTGALLAAGAHVFAVDGDKAAIHALAMAKHKNLTTAQRNLFKEPLGGRELAPFDTILFDPPRAGAKAQAEALAFSNISRVIAVSCNPASFARDAKILTEGGYRLQSLRLIDQFTWSAHVEIAALFTS